MAHDEGASARETRTVTVDAVVAALIFLLGALVAWESRRLGASWGSDGPEAGYFPFYIGSILCFCSILVFVRSCLRWRSDRAVFVSLDRFRQVLVILLPSMGYVLGVQTIGIYLSSALFILLFMKIAGRYGWLKSVLIGAIVSVSAFVLFEVWFQIPLPKGPLEQALGY